MGGMWATHWQTLSRAQARYSITNNMGIWCIRGRLIVPTLLQLFLWQIALGIENTLIGQTVREV